MSLKYNIARTNLNSDVLTTKELHDNSVYKRAVELSDELKPLSFSQSNELTEAKSVLQETDICEPLNDTARKIYYISDIHLNQKLEKRFPEHATKEKITSYINSCVQAMVSTAETVDIFSRVKYYLLVAGDVSFNFEVASFFYTELAQIWDPKHVIVVLGNHELWDLGNNGKSRPRSSVDSVIAKYKKLFNRLEITLLQNDLFIESDSACYVIPEEKLSTMDADDLRAKCLRSSFAVYGGIGFSGYNKELNAINGVYGGTITTLEADKAETMKFQSVYNRLSGILLKTRLIVLTHMPKSDWSDREYNRNWIYVSGHTHKNEYLCDKNRTVYADNQIGYRSITIGLKYFKLAVEYDIFRYYEDGIYPVSREQYFDFYQGAGVSVSFSRNDGLIYMVKRDGFYCFFLKCFSGSVYHLDGGIIKAVDIEDLDYYFENIPYYAAAIQQMLSGYYSALKSVAAEVKKIGGLGNIHGCIVDIDYENHIFINPDDGKITPYYARSITEKTVYPSVEALLKNKYVYQYQNYLKLSAKKNGLSILNENTIDIEIPKFIKETYMYKPSRIMRALQYLTDVHVIRAWSDKILDVEITTKKYTG